jgi:DHA1 family tetracycline resistance protein-like MFS transporter
MFVLCLVVFIGLTGVGIVIPLFPFFAEKVGASPIEVTMLMAVFAAGQFVMAPFWGWLSDRVGRKPIFIVTLAGSALSYLFLGLADNLSELLWSRVFGGVMAGNIPVAFAAASDMSDSGSRAKVMGKIGASFSLGFIFGPAISGIVAGPDPDSANFLLVALVAGSMSVIALVVTIFSFRETHFPKAKPASSFSIKKSLEGLRVLLHYFSYPVLGALIFMNFVFVSGSSMMDSTFSLYAYKEHGFGPDRIGFLFTYLGIIMAIVQGGAIGPLTKRYGDAYVLRAGMIIYMIGLCFLITSDGIYSVIFALTWISIGNSLFVPSSSSLVSQYASSDKQGEIIGLFQAAGNLGRVFTPTFSGYVFAVYGTSAPFVGAALILIPALMLLQVAIRQAVTD